jgi:predicted pyridoxine 5'-phosphate oxidase superfamily flavin-nucleotide-binding protein
MDMVKLPADVKEALANQQVTSFVTADKNGVPNVCLMGFVKVRDDETIIMANVFWKKTEANLKENPKAAISAYMPPMKAYQIKGSVELVTDGPLMNEVADWVASKMANLKPKGAALFHVEEIYSMSPGPSAGERIS